MLQYHCQRGIDNSKSLVRFRVHFKRKQINIKMKFYLAAAVLATVLVAANCAPYQSEWTPDFSDFNSVAGSSAQCVEQMIII